MRYKTRIFVVVFGTTALASVSAQASALVVGSCRPNLPTLTTIGAAVAAAPPGGIIYVCPGTYPEQVVITKNLTLQGTNDGVNSAQPTIVAPSGGIAANTTSLISGNPIAAQIVVKNATKVVVAGLTVDGNNSQIAGCGPNLVGIIYQNASGTIANNAVINTTLGGSLTGCQAGLGIFVQSDNVGGKSAVSITGNVVKNYEKNGITANEGGTFATITGNSVIGSGSTNGAAENSIQVAFGATGSIQKNFVGGDVWAPDMFGDTGNAAAGILAYAAGGVKIASNVVSDTQYGISVSGDNNGDGDGAQITTNTVLTTHLYDGIDVCGASAATISGNTINGSDEAAIHLDSSCGGASTGNTVTSNKGNLGCAGILEGNASNGTLNGNTFINVTSLVAAGDTCQPVAAVPARHLMRRPSAVRP